MIVHATTDDLAEWTGDAAPANAAALLRSASLLIDRETVTAVYRVDRVTGQALDARVLQALADATCAQVATWIALKIDPAKGAADPGNAAVYTKELGTARIAYDRTSAALASSVRAGFADALVPDAAQILATAGLLSTQLSPYPGIWRSQRAWAW